MQDFSDFVNTVSALLSEFGSPGVLKVQLAAGEYDTATGMVGATTTDIPVYGIVMDLTLQSNGFGLKANTMIQHGDQLCYLRPSENLFPVLLPNDTLSIDPADNRLVFGNTTYKITTVKVLDPTSSGTKPLYYELYLRR
jgi:hypothetical protein